MTLCSLVQTSMGLLFLGHVLLGIASFGLESCEAIIPDDTTASIGEKAVIKCRLVSQNIAWMFCPRNSSPYMIASNCALAQSVSNSYRLDKTSNSCNLVIDNVTVSHYGTYTCQDMDLNDHGHSFELGNSKENLALRKNAVQSTTHSAPYQPNLAVDGNNADGDFGKLTCSHTLTNAPVWWAVDLGQETSIGRVRITNEKTAAARMRNFLLGLTNVSPWISPPNITQSSICKYHAGYPAAGIPVDIFCNPDTAPGRYLYLLLTEPDYLVICELEAYYK